MSFIGNIVKSVVGDVTKAAEGVLNGVGNALHGAATFGKGLLSGNPKEALAGAGAIAKGGLELSRYLATGILLVLIIGAILIFPQKPAEKAH